MFETDKEKFDRTLKRAVDEEALIELLKARLGVLRPVVRHLIAAFGLNTIENIG